jgi:hypothetical protein
MKRIRILLPYKRVSSFLFLTLSDIRMDKTCTASRSFAAALHRTRKGHMCYFQPRNLNGRLLLLYIIET